MTGHPVFVAISITLQIFWACASPKAPPKTVKSCAKMYTILPFIVPCPVITPSPAGFLSSRPKLLLRCLTRASNSTKESESNKVAIRSRAVIFPAFCCFSILSGSPSTASLSFLSRPSIFSGVPIICPLREFYNFVGSPKHLTSGFNGLM